MPNLVQDLICNSSLMYLKARYGERNRGIFIEGTPRDLTVSEEDWGRSS